MKKSSLILLVSAAALAGATGAVAQTATPTPPPFGNAVPGQCVLDTQTALTNSNMGKAAVDRLGQLNSAVDSELQPEAQSLQADYKALAAEQKAAATPAAKQAFEQKAESWSNRRDALQQKMQLRQQEMQATQQTVFSAIFQKMIPSINAVVSQKQCATVISADALLHYETPGATQGAEPTSFLYANPAMNITNDVVAKMNASGETLPPFERQHLGGAPTGAPAAAAAAPAAKPVAKPAAPKPAAGK
jgi:Skp family chaperone for outer membrane proteins